MKGWCGNVLGGHEGDIVKTLSRVSGKSNFVSARMTWSQRHLKDQTNQRGGERRDQEDLGCQSYSGVMRTAFTIGHEYNK
jgi:hypothetical protein